jgi:eukaryotic-like serine/threonine-protein kinase
MIAGTLLGGKYRLEELIGRGGMGSVWRAHHLGLNAPVAVKLLNLESGAAVADVVNRFHREARAAAAIRSPHVVQILDHGVDEATAAPFIVMELMEGESLASRLERVGRIRPAEAQRIFTQVARALSRAHEVGIVHRDLKPDNVFLVRNEDEEVAKVLDFGIAKAQAHGLDGGSATQTGALMGTAYYMSPEQISGKKNIDFRTDLWAFGVMACECLTGHRPFQADTLGGLTLRICIEPLPVPSSLGAVPPGFDAWFARILDRNPEQRFASAREAAEALRVVCTGEAAVERVSDWPGGVPSSRASLPSSGSSSAVASATAAPLSRSSSGMAPAQGAKSKSVLVAVILGVVAVAGLGLFGVRAWLAPRNETPIPGSATLAQPVRPPAAVVQPALCEPNGTRCVATTQESCVVGQWGNGSVVAGQCGADCTPSGSLRRCNGPSPQACDAAGHWQDGIACGAAEQCVAGACVAKPRAPAAAKNRATPHSASSPKADCQPNYTLDSDGQKHFKPECFQ